MGRIDRLTPKTFKGSAELLKKEQFNNMQNWKFIYRKTGQEIESALEVYWEVSLDPISDDYTPSEISAKSLFKKWVVEVDAKYPNGLIPIFWFVHVKKHKLEEMPFQFEHFPGIKIPNFLTYYTQPVHPVTNKPMNWLSLPVRDKLWNSKHCDKGGFIQQATGWKPSILQPYVYLPILTSILI